MDTDQAYYRCRYPREYALANTIEHPTNVYLLESAVMPALDRWLAGLSNRKRCRTR